LKRSSVIWQSPDLDNLEVVLLEREAPLESSFLSNPQPVLRSSRIRESESGHGRTHRCLGGGEGRSEPSASSTRDDLPIRRHQATRSGDRDQSGMDASPDRTIHDNHAEDHFDRVPGPIRPRVREGTDSVLELLIADTGTATNNRVFFYPLFLEVFPFV